MCFGCEISRRTFGRALLGAAGFLAAGAPSSANALAKIERTPPNGTGLAAIAAGTLAAAAVASSSPGEVAVLGSGAYRYGVDNNWGDLPPGMSFVEAAGVCIDSRDRVYVFVRGLHPVMVFERDGTFVSSWGEGVGFVRPHGAAIGPDDLLYLTDDGDHTVRKCTQDGKVLLTIGIPGRPAAAFSGEPFNRCTHTALSPSGDIYVSDGYSNARVHKFDPAGRHLTSWGEPGTGPGQFNVVHNICCDEDGLVYVADRENHRVQIFDGAGRYQGQWNNLQRPCGLALGRGSDGLCYIGELGPDNGGRLTRNTPNLGPRVTLTDRAGSILAFLGTEPLGEGDGQFIAPHGVAADSHGDIYVAEVSMSYWPVLFGVEPDHPLRCFRKLIRLPAGSA